MHCFEFRKKSEQSFSPAHFNRCTPQAVTGCSMMPVGTSANITEER